MPITNRSARLSMSAFQAGSSGPCSVASAGVRWKCMPERSTIRFARRASKLSRAAGVAEPACASTIVADGTAFSAASSPVVAPASSSWWMTSGTFWRPATSRTFTSAGSDGLRSILRLTWRTCISPATGARPLARSASSREAAWGEVGSGTG
jgi:hypothetical protein